MSAELSSVVSNSKVPLELVIDTWKHSFETPFQQLGLASDGQSIESFITTHSPLDPSIRLADAPFWSTGQVAFISESLNRDSDWAEIVDQLNVLLRP